MLRNLIAVAFLGCTFALADTDPPRLKDKPITTAGGDVGDKLRKWWKEGTAAGNVGDWYDNRDRGHSDLNTAPYPQLQRIVYTPEELKTSRDWAAQVITKPQVTFGNSSTSAGILQGGSNPRHYYVSPRGLAFLYHHYTHNNVYIYPEHRDHDPGHNGRNDGYGDVYPTNTPYLITSQGSSGSDQPFMQAIPFTLAAFRPEVKKKLTEEGLLMPTLQMILRRTNKHLKDPSEYLTGKAHPTVFEGSWVDAGKMVDLAHEIRADNIPPMVQLKVVEEDAAVLGQDFFEPFGSEKLADTPAVIARIFRGSNGKRRLVVSAEGSYDLNKRPLTFTWKVLRGDPAAIQIKPKNQAGSVVELVVPFPERRPVTPGSPLESNRIDIGVFVHNGVYYSAPAFITFFSFDSEARTYDEKGRVLEIGYGMGEATCMVADWAAFFTAVNSDGLAGKLLRFTNEERGILATAGDEHRPLAEAVGEARGKLQAADKARQKADADLKKAEQAKVVAQKEATDKPSEPAKAALEKAVARSCPGPASSQKSRSRDPGGPEVPGCGNEGGEGIPRPDAAGKQGILAQLGRPRLAGGPEQSQSCQRARRSPGGAAQEGRPALGWPRGRPQGASRARSGEEQGGCCPGTAAVTERESAAGGTLDGLRKSPAPALSCHHAGGRGVPRLRPQLLAGQLRGRPADDAENLARRLPLQPQRR